MSAPAIYYGLNSLSNNMIMADRKRLRTASQIAVCLLDNARHPLRDVVQIPFRPAVTGNQERHLRWTR